MKADLHIHSQYSYDSYESIEDIVNTAKENQVEFIAVCDHNAIEGSLELVKRKDIRSLTGIEIDCFFEKEIVHILGYGCDLTDLRFKEIELNYASELERCSETLIRMMETKYGIEMDRGKIIEYSKGKPVTHVAIIRYLLDTFDHKELKLYQSGARAFSPVANYYWDHLALGKEFYLAKKLPDVREIVGLIHQTNGAAIVAHPSVNIGCDEQSAKKLLEIGADGFEVYCSYHDVKQNRFYHDLCQKANCLETCGSDYHGMIKPQVKLGMTHYEEDCSLIVNALIERISG